MSEHASENENKMKTPALYFNNKINFQICNKFVNLNLRHRHKHLYSKKKKKKKGVNK